MTNLLTYWTQALHSPKGLRIKVSDRVLFRQQLYRARDSAENKDELKTMAVMLPKTPKNEVWIVHKRDSDV